MHVIVKIEQSSISGTNEPIGGLRGSDGLIFTLFEGNFKTLINSSAVPLRSIARDGRIEE